MEQLTLFKPPYKYIIDSCSIFSQKPDRTYRRQVHESLWEKIEECIRTNLIVICSEIFDEIKDEDIKKWLQLHRCVVLEIDDDVQLNVRKIVTEHPEMIEFTGGGGTSSGDAFLLATAMKYHLSIITEENQQKAKKLPMISKNYGVSTFNIIELCEQEKWVL